MTDIIYQYFIRPIFTGEGYNPVNTVVYAIGFLVAMFLAKKVFNKANVEINKKWFNSIVWMSVIGGLLRAIEDWVVKNYGVLPTHVLAVTPGIYVTLATIVLVVLAYKPEDFYDTMKRTSLRIILILIFTLVAIFLTTGIHNLPVAALIIVSASIAGYFTFDILKRLNLCIQEDIWLLTGQALDGFATALILSMVPGYFEQHVVTGALINHFGPVVYPAIKLAIAITIVVLLRKEEEDREWAWILRLFITIIGLGPGIRDTTRLLMGV